MPGPATDEIALPGMPARLAACLLGIVLLGLGIGLTVRADLGLSPWDVLHQGLSDRTGIPMGTITIAVGAVVLLAWIPLRQRPGIGTVLNVIAVGLMLDVFLAILPETGHLAARWAMLLAGLVLIGTATGLYIGSGLGSGPRDGLMMGLARRGISVRLARTVLELTVLAVGFLLGGRVGIGTVVLALGIGPVVHLALDRLALVPAHGSQPEPAVAG